MSYYIDITHADPTNGCRSVWPAYMIREAVAEYRAVKQKLDEMRNAKSTKERYVIMRQMEEIEMHTLYVLTDTLEDDLSYLEQQNNK